MSRDTLRESGIPPVRESGIPPARESGTYDRTRAARSDDLARAALAESSRAEANLAMLLGGLRHIGLGIAAARDVNATLARRIEELRALLARSVLHELELEQRVRLLEHTVERTRREAARERAAFIEEEDAFLAELLADHERELVELHRRPRPLARTSGVEPRQDVVDPETERIPAPVRPPPTLSPSTPLGVIKTRTVRMPMPPPPAASVMAAEVPPGFGPPRPASRPPLRQKPDPSTRPLVGYSLRSGDVAEEHVDPSAKRSPDR